MKEKNKDSKILLEDYLLDGEIPFLLKGMGLDSEEEESLNKWKFSLPLFYNENNLTIENRSQEDSGSKTEAISESKLNPNKIKNAFSIFSNLENQFNIFISLISNKINNNDYTQFMNIIESEDFKSLLKILEFIPNYNEEYLLYLNTQSQITPKSITLYSFGLTAILGSELKIPLNTLNNMLLVTMISNIFFFIHRLEKIKLIAIKKNNENKRPFIQQKKIERILELLKEVTFPPNINYLFIYQHVALDGSGILKLNKNKITVPVNLMYLINFHTWNCHPYSINLHQSFPYRTIEIIKKKDKFFKNVLATFLTKIGIIEPGKVIQLKTPKEILTAVVIHSNGINKPTVKIILKGNKQFDYSKELINLNTKNYENWEIIIVKDPVKTQKIQTSFLQIIANNQFNE